METIFTLIVVLLPVIFKLIGKRLEKSAAQPQETEGKQAPIEDWAEVLRRYIEVQQPQEDVRPAAPVQQPIQQPVQQQPIQQQRPQPQPTQQRPGHEGVQQARPQGRKAPKKVKPVLQEEAPRTQEKIDKKKLILDSEIMKPKYTE